ncbi:MAG: tetratricopeptide repeat protein, partial [Deltaproteobacteria bacterium]|nr:tetratricopeptide repeat protein [Deltaproteobacteria bacterium]
PGRKAYKYGVLAGAAVVAAILVFMTIRQQGAWRDSMALWSHEIRSVPRAPIGYYNRGVLYADMRDFRRALDDYAMAAALDPEFKDTYVNRGIALLELGRYGEAIDDFSRYVALDPRYAPAYVNRGNARLKAGDMTGGMEDLNEAAKLDPEDPVPYYNLGFAYLTDGDTEKARLCFMQAYSLGFDEAATQLRMLEMRAR